MSASELGFLVQVAIGLALIMGMVLLLRRPSPGLLDLRELTVQTQTLKSDLGKV
jgi:hypothetical protein